MPRPATLVTGHLINGHCRETATIMRKETIARRLFTSGP